MVLLQITMRRTSGVYIKNASNIQRSTIAFNTGVQGGAVYLDGSSSVFNNVNITNNSSSDVGGGIFCVYNSQPGYFSICFYDNYGLDGNMEHIPGGRR